MSDERLVISADEAIALLKDDGDYIHNFANPEPSVLLGVDFSREDAEKAMRAAERIEIGGEQCKAMGHPIVVFEGSGRYTFFEADMQKVGAFEAAKAQQPNMMRPDTMPAVKKKELVELTVDELAALIRRSAGRSVRTTYPGGSLIVGTDTEWCLSLLAEMRDDSARTVQS